MTRSTIASQAAGSGDVAVAKGTKANGSDRNQRLVAASGEDSVLLDQFTREFNAVLRQVKETQRGASDGDKADVAAFSASLDAQAERRSVAHFGAISQRLLALVRRLLHHTDELALSKKAILLLSFGDKFAAVFEFVAAERYFYQQAVEIWGSDTTTSITASTTTKPKNEVYVQAMYGAALCQFQVAKRADPFIRFPGTLEKLLAALQRLQHGMEIAVQLERKTPHQYAWLLLNGSVLIYSIAHPLQILGFEREVIAFFKWSILCLESTVMLSTTKYILWRLQIYSDVCECLERMATKSVKKAPTYLQSAMACADHASQAVKRLRKEEELDLPLPAHVVTTLREAEIISDMLTARCRSLSKGDFFGRKAIESTAAATRDRLRLAVDALAKAQDLPVDHAGVLELLSLAMEMVGPLFQDGVESPLSAAPDATALLPLALHLTLLRQAYRLQRFHDAALLLQSANKRLAAVQNAESVRMEMRVYSALLELDTPRDNTEEPTETATVSDSPIDHLLVVAHAMKHFVRNCPDVLTTTTRDFLQSVALRLWSDGGVKVIQELDNSPTPREDTDLDTATNTLVSHGVQLLDVVYMTLRKIDFEDVVLLGEVCLRLCFLLHVQQDRRKAVRTLRDYLSRTDAYRDAIVNATNHFSSRVDCITNAIAHATFSFDVDVAHAKSDCQISTATAQESSRQCVGVEGTGSQFGGLHQELACLQVDAMLLMFQLELEESVALDAIELSATPAATPGAQPVQPSRRRQPIVAIAEAALEKEFKKNAYARVLLNIQRMRFAAAQAPEQRAERAAECFKLLRQAETNERELLKNLAAAGDVIETATPRAPRILMRCCRSISVKIIPFKPANAAVRRRPVAYYMVFAKPSGAGTAVSLNNSEYPGTGEPIYASALRVTVSGLAPNTSYVFAVAAFDEQGDVIEGIGATSKPVVTVNPLPLAACYGYLAQACYELKLMEPARKAAMQVYDYVVSKNSSDRAGWAANFFYRHSLKRTVIARWPLPLLNLAVQSILVICDEEDGDALRDGQLTSTGASLRARQIAILEASKMIAIGLEIASAAADHEQIRVLCFKGYRILLPLLHLEDADALPFAALTTYYQALWCIPSPLWDTDTRSIAARIAFELMRIAWRHRHLADAVFQQVTKLKASNEDVGALSDSTPSTEMNALLDAIALAECTIGQPLGESTSVSRPTTAAAAAQLGGKGAALVPAAAPATKAPVAANVPVVAQAAISSEAQDVVLPRLSDLLAQATLGLRDAFKMLEPFIKYHHGSMEAFCKLCQCAIDSGDEAAVDEWMLQMKVSGSIGSEFKNVLKSVGLEHLLPNPAPPVVPVAQATPSAPNTARSSTKTPRSADVAGSPDTPVSPRPLVVPDPEYGEDDEYLYLWCGEASLIQAKILMGNIVQYRSQHDDADVSRGPLYDYSFRILKDGGAIELQATSDREEPSQSALSTGRLQTDSGEEAPPSTSREEGREEGDSIGEIFHQLLARVATSCRLFVLARAWQALQAAAQLAANAIWLVWASPDEFAGKGRLASSLDHLTTCVDAILDMIEDVTITIKEEQSGRTATTVTPVERQDPLALSTTSGGRNATLTLASTTVVMSAMSSLNADQTWISNLLEFTVQALLAAKQWHKLVVVGKKYHLLSGGGSRFSEKMLPLMVFAQQQYLAEQTALLESAQATLSAFVTAFNDAEAKKKKKKSRLVVEEVLTPEEIEFRKARDVMESHIRELTVERNARQLELDGIQQMHDAVSRSTNKCTQALDACHDLVEKYRRHGDAVVTKKQIASAYSHCVALARQKRQRRVAGKALQELGDFLWARGEIKAAVKSWNEAIDNAFNALHATTCWRDILGSKNDEEKELLASSGDPWVEGDGLWICLESCVALMKLILYDSPSANTSIVELARMAAAAFTRVVTKCALPHPTRSFLYGLHQVFGQLWPGRELLVDTERLDAPRLGVMFVVVIQVLLQYEQPVEAMPLITGYEYIARHCFGDVDHVANALRLRVEALTQCGRFHDAFESLALVLVGVSSIGSEAKPAVTSALVEKLQYRDDKPIKDAANAAVISWLTAFDVPQVHAELRAHQYTPETTRLILVATLKLVVSLSQREPIEEEAASTLRQVATTMATAITGLLTSSSSPPSDTVAEIPVATGANWDALMTRHVQAEVLLQQSIVSFNGGQWSAAQDLGAQAIQQAADSPARLGDATGSTDTTLSFDHRVPSLLVLKASTLMVRARLVSIKCELAQGSYKAAIQQIRVAIQEARAQGEPSHFVQQLELLRMQALVFSGSAATAARELSGLRDTFLKSHSQESSAFVELLRMQAALLRSEAMAVSTEAAPKLTQALVLLEEAEESLDRLLRRDGWTGVDVNPVSDKRLSLYHPCIPTFVELKAEIAQALMDTPASSADQAARNSQRALLSIDMALQAIDHSIKSLAPTKARLLLLKGAIVKTTLVSRKDGVVAESGSSSSSTQEAFELCVSTLTACVEEAIRIEAGGGHDREVIRLALLELVDLYGAKIIVGRDSEHLQAAFHYLNLALATRSFQQILVDSLELQSGTLANTDKLPTFVISAILSQQPIVAATIPVAEPAKPSGAAAGKAGAAQAAAATDAGKKTPGIDAQRVINYFITVMRESRLLPVCTGLQQDLTVLLHSFLVQNHSTYATLCCLSSLPAVPRDDPEIKAGLICAHWKRELAPAFSEPPPTLSLFFTLGTTRLDTQMNGDVGENQDAIQQRVDLFATAPLLSKRTGIVEERVLPIQEQLSRLRIQMEDEDSLVIDRSAFASTFTRILHELQQLLRDPQSKSTSQDALGAPHDDADSVVDASTETPLVVLDSLGLVIPVVCTLDAVKLLESLLHTDRGVHNAVDNALCYFLRDLLDK